MIQKALFHLRADISHLSYNTQSESRAWIALGTHRADALWPSRFLACPRVSCSIPACKSFRNTRVQLRTTGKTDYEAFTSSVKLNHFSLFSSNYEADFN